MEKRPSPQFLNIILETDVILTNKLLKNLLQHATFRSIRAYSKYLEVSCNGIAWLAAWLAFIWIVNNKDLYQMQLNMLFGLILDVIVIAVVKAYFRRRRPTKCDDMLTIGPDKFSFPSGHASRAFYVLWFFTVIYSIPCIWWPPIVAWACSVSLSRLILQRHYLLDICAGIAIGIVEAYVLKLLWLSENTAITIINFISNDYLPGGAD